MMRTFMIIFTSTLFFSPAFGFDPVIKIDQILSLKNPKKIHIELLKLKKENKTYMKSLMKEKSYKPELFDYSSTLDIILAHIPSKLEQIDSCKTLVGKLESDYKTTWENLDPLTHRIWPAFKRICKP